MNETLFDMANLAHGPLTLLVDLVVKGTLVLVVGCASAFCLRRSSAAVRHQVWCLTLGGLIVLPVATWFVPSWRLTIPVAARKVATPPAIAGERDIPAAVVV